MFQVEGISKHVKEMIVPSFMFLFNRPFCKENLNINTRDFLVGSLCYIESER